jgi:hypothetical protein
MGDEPIHVRWWSFLEKKARGVTYSGGSDFNMNVYLVLYNLITFIG